MQFTSLIFPPNDLLDVVVGDLIPLGEVLPGLHLTLNHLHVARLKLLQFFWAEPVQISVLFLHFLNLKVGPNALLLLDALQHDLSSEGLLADALVILKAESFAVILIIISLSDWPELTHEEDRVVSESLVAGPHPAFALFSSPHSPLLLLVFVV